MRRGRSSFIDGVEEADSSLDFFVLLFVIMTTLMVLRSENQSSALDAAAGEKIDVPSEFLTLEVEGDQLMLAGEIDGGPYRESASSCPTLRDNSRNLVLEVGLNQGLTEGQVDLGWTCARSLTGPEGSLKISLR